MRIMQKLLVTLPLLVVTSAVAVGQDAEQAEEKVQKERDKIIMDLLDGTALVGVFTTDDQPADKPPAAERYEITKVQKMTDSLYAITARIKYGKLDVRVPIAVPVKWAGMTPVITMDNFEIPRVGTFSARVLFHGKRYVGTWQHGKVGGHMYGRLEKLKLAEKKAGASKKPDSTSDDKK